MRLHVLSLAPALLGCSALGGIEAGYAQHLGPERPPAGAAVNLHVGFGTSDHASLGSGLGTSLRLKRGAEFTQVYVAPHFYVLGGGTDAVPYARLGLGLIQWESWKGRDVWGALSPMVDLGYLIHLQGVRGLTVSTSFEYDVRFTANAPSRPAVLFCIGWGAGGTATL